MSLGNPVFIQSRPSGGDLYLWSPPPNNVNGNRNVNNNRNNVGNYFCDATPYSQGEDWITRYVYNVTVVNGLARHDAYVQCDYVQ